MGENLSIRGRIFPFEKSTPGPCLLRTGGAVFVLGKFRVSGGPGNPAPTKLIGRLNVTSREPGSKTAVHPAVRGFSVCRLGRVDITARLPGSKTAVHPAVHEFDVCRRGRVDLKKGRETQPLQS